MKISLFFLLGLILGGGAVFLFFQSQKEILKTPIATFEECAFAGYPILESFPRQCKTPDGKTFVEALNDQLKNDGMIILDSPLPQERIASPLTITGKARGNWFFEATFPVVLTNWDGLIIAEHYAEAQGNWMTEEFVPFKAVLEFDSPVFPDAPADHFSRRGSLILKKDNPSGLPEHDDAIEIVVFFAE